jgi:hypothetical protein
VQLLEQRLILQPIVSNPKAYGGMVIYLRSHDLSGQAIYANDCK